MRTRPNITAMAEVTLPEITQISEEVKGAGIAGTFDGTFVGHLEAMSLTLNFRSVTTDAIKLAEPRKHQLDLRAAQQSWDNSTGRYVQQAVKHVLVVNPKKFAPGKLAPGIFRGSVRRISRDLLRNVHRR